MGGNFCHQVQQARRCGCWIIVDESLAISLSYQKPQDTALVFPPFGLPSGNPQLPHQNLISFAFHIEH